MPSDAPFRAGISPQEQARPFHEREAQLKEAAAREEALATAVARVLGYDDASRNGDQKLVHDWLTREVWLPWGTNVETLPIFEGRREKALEVIDKIRKAIAIAAR